MDIHTSTQPRSGAATAQPRHAAISEKAREQTTATSADRTLLALCLTSLAIYLVCSDAVRSFVREVTRLTAKL